MLVTFPQSSAAKVINNRDTKHANYVHRVKVMEMEEMENKEDLFGSSGQSLPGSSGNFHLGIVTFTKGNSYKHED